MKNSLFLYLERCARNLRLMETSLDCRLLRFLTLQSTSKRKKNEENLIVETSCFWKGLLPSCRQLVACLNVQSNNSYRRGKNVSETIKKQLFEAENLRIESELHH